jgi:hypothetical protein
LQGFFSIFDPMEDKNISLDNFLRQNYKCTNELPRNPITTADIIELLELNGMYITIAEVNLAMATLGFVGRVIPYQADKLWLVEQGSN